MFCCYILHSESLNRFYTGVCQDNLAARIQKHNDQSYGAHRFTANAQDWQLYLRIDCESNAHALKIEKHIKSMKSSRYIKNLAQYPEIIEKLKQRFGG